MEKILIMCKKKRKHEKYFRAALVTTTCGLKGVIRVSQKESCDLHALICTHPFEGVTGQMWAKRWLFGSGSSAAKKLTRFKRLNKLKTKNSIKECSFTIDQVKKELALASNPRKIGLGAKQRRLCNIL